MTLLKDADACPYCVAPRQYHYDVREQLPCKVCGNCATHTHFGITHLVACGSLIGLWARLFRWCWTRGPHMHRACSACGAHWIERESTIVDRYDLGFADGVKHARQEMRP